jgi:hypothetical protein
LYQAGRVVGNKYGYDPRRYNQGVNLVFGITSFGFDRC